MSPSLFCTLQTVYNWQVVNSNDATSLSILDMVSLTRCDDTLDSRFPRPWGNPLTRLAFTSTTLTYEIARWPPTTQADGSRGKTPRSFRF